jgi:hypothetical protein
MTAPPTAPPTGPKFIFGHLNKNFRAKPGAPKPSASEQQAAADPKQQAADLTARLQKRLGRKPTPAEVQQAFRRQLMANVRGRMLKLLMEKNGGKPPTPEQFTQAMDKWREKHLLDRMADINKQLGTTGAGYPGGGVQPPTRRSGWSQRLQTALTAAAKQLSTGSKASIDETLRPKLARELTAFLADQRREIVARVRGSASHVVAKPGDSSAWWDGEKWDAKLKKLLAPYLTSAAELAAGATQTRLGAHKAEDLLGSRVLERLLAASGKRITGINETTRQHVIDAIRRGIVAGEGPGTIGDRLEDLPEGVFGEYRGELIARTETGIVANLASVESYREYGVAKVSVIDGDEDEGCAAANGSEWTLAEAQERIRLNTRTARATSRPSWVRRRP